MNICTNLLINILNQNNQANITQSPAVPKGTIDTSDSIRSRNKQNGQVDKTCCILANDPGAL
jgi:hypothetical protein